MHRCSLLAVAISAALLASCTGCRYFVGAAENCNSHPTIAHEWLSPDGKLKAVENRTTCPGWYALTNDIVSSDGTTKTPAFMDRPVSQVRPEAWPNFKVDWKSDRELWITYPAGQDTTCISTAAGLQVHCVDGTVSR